MESVIFDKRHIIDTINGNINTAFEWGQWDCSIFVVECFLPSFRDQLTGAYNDEAGALAKIDELGGFDDFIASVGGIEVEGGANFAKNYTVGKLKDHQTLGVIEGRNIITITPDAGMVRLPRRMAEKAWSFE